MTESPQSSDIKRAKRRMLMGQMRQLAADMENKELNDHVSLARLQNNEDQFRLTQYKILAGKLIFEQYESGECSSGRLNQVLSYWSKMPYPESADWNYVQGFESICWHWYGEHFADLKTEMGELTAYAYILRLLISEFTQQDLD